MTELEKAVAWLEHWKMVKECDARNYPHRTEHAEIADNCRVLLDALRQMKPVSGSTSDGYHTFDELYEHRTALFATLCNMRSDISWKSMKHDDGTMYDGMFIAGIKTPEGQYTYHCDMKYLYMFAHAPEVDKAPPYDGHQPKDYPRLLGLSENSLYRQSMTDEAVQRAIEWLEAEKESAQNDWERSGAEWRMEPGAQETHDERMAAFDLAIQALRQMRSEPCECTEICGICNNPNYHIHSGIWWKSASTEYGRENREIPTRHCPNCGRRMVKQDD